MDLTTLPEMLAKKVLILTASTGGGHKSNAASLEAWIKRYYGDAVEVEVYDAFKQLPHFFGKDPVSLFYYVTSVHFPKIWRWVIDASSRQDLDKLEKQFVFFGGILGRKAGEQKLKEFEPDVIISTFTPVVAPTRNVLTKLGLNIPLKVLITDIISAPHYWFGKSADEYYVMSEDALQKGQQHLPNKTFHILPPLLHPKFFEEYKAIKNKRKRILLLAGGEGIHNLDALVTLVARNTNYDIDVICAKDKITLDILTKAKKQHAWHHVNLHGFITNIEQYLKKCDIVITKAGPATIFEILRFKKPLICYHYIYGTEQENVDFLIKNNYGIYEPDIQLIPGHIEALLSGTTQLNTREVRPLYEKAITKMITIPDDK
jgi:UDP-N-acetylglucosamine:LPS N-acetylglucosamine transferase